MYEKSADPVSKKVWVTGDTTINIDRCATSAQTKNIHIEAKYQLQSCVFNSTGFAGAGNAHYKIIAIDKTNDQEITLPFAATATISTQGAGTFSAKVGSSGDWGRAGETQKGLNISSVSPREQTVNGVTYKIVSFGATKENWDSSSGADCSVSQSTVNVRLEMVQCPAVQNQGQFPCLKATLDKSFSHPSILVSAKLVICKEGRCEENVYNISIPANITIGYYYLNREVAPHEVDSLYINNIYPNTAGGYQFAY